MRTLITRTFTLFGQSRSAAFLRRYVSSVHEEYQAGHGLPEGMRFNPDNNPALNETVERMQEQIRSIPDNPGTEPYGDSRRLEEAMRRTEAGCLPGGFGQ